MCINYKHTSISVCNIKKPKKSMININISVYKRITISVCNIKNQKKSQKNQKNQEKPKKPRELAKNVVVYTCVQ